MKRYGALNQHLDVYILHSTPILSTEFMQKSKKTGGTFRNKTFRLFFNILLSKIGSGFCAIWAMEKYLPMKMPRFHYARLTAAVSPSGLRQNGRQARAAVRQIGV